MTGTRGKSSVTRLIAALLKEAGFSVLARTTGSKPVILFPEGNEKEIRRQGSPSILEGKKLLKIGDRLGVRAVVAELMSIHPESIFVESVQIFQPHILIITNVRLDHLAQMGRTRKEIACCFASSIPEKCTVFIPQEEFLSLFQKAAAGVNSSFIRVPPLSIEEYKRLERKSLPFEIDDNIRLSLAVAEFLGIERELAFQGMRKSRPDFGSLKIWKAKIGSPGRIWYFVSCFAANDPESTRQVLSWLKERGILKGEKMLGLLNLRGDRGDRTIQWIKEINAGNFPEFNRFVLTGEHAFVFKRRLKFPSRDSAYVLKKQTPEAVMNQISSIGRKEEVLVGMGNMGGMGEVLVNYWDNIGESCDI